GRGRRLPRAALANHGNLHVDRLPFGGRHPASRSNGLYCRL
ncbi:MAG: hypothetical protein AVDCRST_MAG76-2212, partial [uncultured Acidimicrobiales bacterium]